MKKEFLKKIKSRGYWRVNFQPVVDKIKLPTMETCREIVEKSSVSLRGWNYPHIPNRNDDTTGYAPCVNYYEGWIDWENHKEFWRMYKSGQFLHYTVLREDWFDEELLLGSIEREKVAPMAKLNIIGSVIYELTEICEFLARLVRSGLYDEGVVIDISLNNTAGRELWISDPNRGPFFHSYKTGAEIIPFFEQLTKEQILKSPRDLALRIMRFVFENFDWHNPSPDVLRKDQENLLNRLI